MFSLSNKDFHISFSIWVNMSLKPQITAINIMDGEKMDVFLISQLVHNLSKHYKTMKWNSNRLVRNELVPKSMAM